MSSTTIPRATRRECPVNTSRQAVSPTAHRDVRVTATRSEKITDEHLQRSAIVYVRQSTQQQVLEHRESTARQYALKDRAVALGWPAAAVEVIDRRSGAQREFRRRPKRISTLVGGGQLGSRRFDSGVGDEPARAIVQGLACVVGIVRDLPYAAGRRRRSLRSEPVQRPLVVRPERDDERSGTAHPQESPSARDVEQGRAWRGAQPCADRLRADARRTIS